MPKVGSRPRFGLGRRHRVEAFEVCERHLRVPDLVEPQRCRPQRDVVVELPERRPPPQAQCLGEQPQPACRLGGPPGLCGEPFETGGVDAVTGQFQRPAAGVGGEGVPPSTCRSREMSVRSDCSAERGGACPHTASITRPCGTTSPEREARTASTKRCVGLPMRTGVPSVSTQSMGRAHAPAWHRSYGADAASAPAVGGCPRVSCRRLPGRTFAYTGDPSAAHRSRKQLA